jgi:hypothetical protein
LVEEFEEEWAVSVRPHRNSIVGGDSKYPKLAIVAMFVVRVPSGLIEGYASSRKGRMWIETLVKRPDALKVDVVGVGLDLRDDLVSGLDKCGVEFSTKLGRLIVILPTLLICIEGSLGQDSGEERGSV